MGLIKKMGRPEKDVDWDKFEELCHFQCTYDEIASMCKISKPTLYERVKKKYGDEFPTIYKRFSEGGRCSLRRTQFKLANKNAAMAIWLGKQYLGQVDTQQERAIQPEIFTQFIALMNQISALQSSAKSDLKMEESKTNSDQ